VSWALGTFSDGQSTFAGVVVDEEQVIDLSSHGFASTLELFEDWDAARERVATIARTRDGELRRIDALRVLPPVMSRQILQAGANYFKHVIELGIAQGVGAKPGMTDEEVREEVTRIMSARAAGGEPYLFLGAVSALCGARDDIVLPPEGEEHDWELELAVVIGRGGRRVPPELALEHVAGYTISNDITMRDRVYRPDLGPIGTDWVRSKNSPTFLPTGPYILPAQFVEDPMDLRITLRLNGEVMQDESTADMIFDVARLVSYASERVTLLPGDLLLTGSPAGNGSHWRRFLAEGDVIEASITVLGSQRNRCVAEGVPHAAGAAA
jgi:2-keto-4-pentenoate hydratase/2-oxohepta-3-ene-1,7-dioic acid hydratase in catechol pathway